MKEDQTYEGDLMNTGKKAEEIVFDWIKKQQDVNNFTDVRDVPVYRQADIDCIFWLKDKKITAEIKYDSWLGKGNLLFEQNRLYHSGQFYVGWFWRSKADLLYYYSPTYKMIYVFSFPEVRKKLGEIIMNSQNWEIKSWLKVIPTDKDKTTINLVIPETLFIDCMKTFSL